MTLRTLVSEKRTLWQIAIAMNTNDRRVRKRFAAWNQRHKCWEQLIADKYLQAAQKTLERDKIARLEMEKCKVGEINIHCLL